MALVVSTLKNDLVKAFQAMTDGDDKVFSEKVSKATDDYTETGKVTTADAGAIPSGAFTGSGTGGNTTDDSICEKIVYAACNVMKTMTAGGNAYLAAQLALAIHTMVMQGEVKTNVTGTVIPPGSSPVPMSGTAKGTQMGTAMAAMQASFLAAFTAMDAMTEGGDEYLATQIAAAVDTYLKSAVINTQGQAALAGSVGVGAMT
ncbi:hypothetical protein FACS1894106_2410 [Spirochaetia bacterium]|nr:hypothetical protein FACS1894106_2410 [Spirochaetia bacterium]